MNRTGNPRPNKRRRRQRRIMNPPTPRSTPLMWNLISQTGFPDAINTKLKWTQDYNRTTGTVAVRSFAMNGLFSVDLTGGGPRQPTYFDQYMLLYTRYEVFASSIKMILLSRDDTIIYLAAIYPSITGTPVTEYPNYRDQPFSAHAICGHARGPGKVSLGTRMSVRKIVGRNTSSINYTGSITTNPSALNYFHTIVENGPGDTTDANFYQTVEITFSVRFYMRRSVQETALLNRVLVKNAKEEEKEDEPEFIGDFASAEEAPSNDDK